MSAMHSGSAPTIASGGQRALALPEVIAALAGAAPHRLAIPGFRHAAVLVPLLDRGPGAGGGLELLLTVRAATLRSHAGQIALPGGRLEPGEDFVDAALRETAEEVGIAVPRADVIGELSDHPSPAGFVARPIVARVPWPQTITPDPNEVAEVFTVPLDVLRATEPTSRLVELERFKRRIFSYRYQDRDIWGFTGNVVRNLFDVIDGRAADPAGSYQEDDGGEDPFGR